MLKHIYFFIDEQGRSPVEAALKELSDKEDMKVRAYLKILKEYGHALHRPIADYLGEGIYELRPQSHRVFYFFFLKDSAVLLHVIRKKTDRIPSNDLDLCVRRRKEVEALRHIKEIDE